MYVEAINEETLVARPLVTSLCDFVAYGHIFSFIILKVLYG